MTKTIVPDDALALESLIQTIRGQRVILDVDLAKIYGVPTKRLNEQVHRNVDRFPSDFVFQLTPKEAANLRSQFATSSLQNTDNQQDNVNRSQIATGSSKHRDPRFAPYAFTEHGAITEVLQQIMLLLNPPPEPEPPQKQLGFHVREKRAAYRTRRSFA